MNGLICLGTTFPWVMIPSQPNSPFSRGPPPTRPTILHKTMSTSRRLMERRLRMGIAGRGTFTPWQNLTALRWAYRMDSSLVRISSRISPVALPLVVTSWSTRRIKTTRAVSSRLFGSSGGRKRWGDWTESKDQLRSLCGASARRRPQSSIYSTSVWALAWTWASVDPGREASLAGSSPGLARRLKFESRSRTHSAPRKCSPSKPAPRPLSIFAMQPTTSKAPTEEGKEGRESNNHQITPLHESTPTNLKSKARFSVCFP